MKVEPVSQHQWLQQFCGSWTYQHSCLTGPDSPPSVSTGKTTVASVGELWIQMISEFEMEPGKQEQSIITLGYDPARGAFVGTFIASMMYKLWLYEGQLDSASRVLTLKAEGPNFTGDGNANYEDIIELVDSNSFRFRSRIQNKDGSWTQFMDGTYHRA
ncbi:MAG TPA: DUF1579 domain-containing protein [Gemmatales bacterium]|nr:DUF1579 domain-containing protein [Gemmatales bacterium]HMP18657.1 DUF1579 domain-containing protein [Gemmatales bacterium]